MNRHSLNSQWYDCLTSVRMFWGWGSWAAYLGSVLTFWFGSEDLHLAAKTNTITVLFAATILAGVILIVNQKSLLKIFCKGTSGRSFSEIFRVFLWAGLAQIGALIFLNLATISAHSDGYFYEACKNVGVVLFWFGLIRSLDLIISFYQMSRGVLKIHQNKYLIRLRDDKVRAINTIASTLTLEDSEKIQAWDDKWVSLHDAFVKGECSFQSVFDHINL